MRKSSDQNGQLLKEICFYTSINGGPSMQCNPIPYTDCLTDKDKHDKLM